MGMMMHRHMVALRAENETARKAVTAESSPEVREGSAEKIFAEEKPVERHKGGRPRKGA